MPTIETSVTISKPVEKVFEYITNLDKQKKLSAYITGVEVDGPVKLGTKYKIETTSMGHKNTTTNEVVAFEPNKKFGVKTFAAPPASDVTNTYLFEADGKTIQSSPCKWTRRSSPRECPTSPVWKI